jgi:hypothetical protein
MKVTSNGPPHNGKALTRGQAFQNLAERITRAHGHPCATIQYDIALQELKVMSATGTLLGASFRSPHPAPLLALVLTKRLPLIIPSLDQLNTITVSERIKQSGGREFLDTENHSVILGGQQADYPRRLVIAALPRGLSTGSVLIYAIPSLIPSFPSQGLVLEHSPQGAGFTPEQIRHGEGLANLFCLETRSLSFGNT